MKTNSLQKISLLKIVFSISFLLITILSIPIGCKDESMATALPYSGNNIQSRDGNEDPLSTSDVLELLGESCVPGSIEVGTGCNDVQYTDTMNITLPSYSGCTFVIVFYYYLCPGPGLLDLTMSDFQILSHNCSAFTSNLNSAIVTGGSTLTNFLENFELLISNKIEENLIAQYVPANSYPCLQGLFFTIHFLQASCYKRCFFTLNNGTTETYVKVACGTDCCERHTRVCTSHGETIVETYYVNPTPPTCADPPDFTGNPVLDRCDRETSCTYKCIEE